MYLYVEKGIDRTRTPWVFTVIHSPWYNTNAAHHDEANTVAMRANMEGLFHDYEVRQNTVTLTGTVWLDLL
jgi:hypothetical protein